MTVSGGSSISVPMIESAQVGVGGVARALCTPPTESLKSVSPVKTTAAPARPPGAALLAARAGPASRLPLGALATRNESIPAVWPGVCSGRTSSAPKRSVCPASTAPIPSASQALRLRGARLAALRPSRSSSRSAALISTSSFGQRARSVADLTDVVEVVVGEQHVRGR